MAENTLLTRIQLKYDTLINWNASSFILKKGEMAIAEIPSGSSNSGLTPPAIGIKVGDGVHTFTNLPWIQAAAGDVYSWAKAATKPTYAASEITGLQDYISGNISDTNTQYQIIRGTGNNSGRYYLQKKEIGETTWTTQSTLDFTDIYGVATKVDTIETWLNSGQGDMGEDGFPSLLSRIGYSISQSLGTLNVTDTAQSGYYVSSVSQTNGKISVNRAQLSAADLNGILAVSHGGLGVNTLATGQVLVGDGTNPVTTRPIVTEINDDNPGTGLVSEEAVATYLQTIVSDLQTAFSGAMHFKGFAVNEITVGGNQNPFNTEYTPTNGDVVIYETAEYVWTGNGLDQRWQLLGDESSYIVHGSITDSDISGTLSQTKITNLTTDLANKVDKETGKGLSTNDYTTTEKNKLAGIASGAQVNTIEKIYLNNVEQTIEDKEVHLTVDLSSAGTVKGARVPTLADETVYEDIPLDSTTKKLTFNNIALTGDVANLTQDSGTVLVFNCGTATTVIN